jgi:hypothetical protein
MVTDAEYFACMAAYEGGLATARETATDERAMMLAVLGKLIAVYDNADIPFAYRFHFDEVVREARNLVAPAKIGS